MQTRRDQLQAFRFQNRRALAALVTGDPNVVDPPMRRLTVFTVAGIMIAVLVTVGFTLFGLIRPKAGDAWKEAGSIIVEQETGATYVYLQGVLHPVANYASAVLAVGNQDVHTVEVEQDDISGATRGVQIGIVGLPDTLPKAGDLVGSPVSACSRQKAGSAADEIDVRTSVLLGDDADARRLGAQQGVLVDSGAGTQSYLLLDGHRLAIGSGAVASSLNLASARSLRVGRAFLDAVPAGTDLAPPTLPGVGSPAGVPGVKAVVGQLLRVSDSQYFVALRDGAAAVNPVQRALLQALPAGPGRTLLDAVDVSVNDALAKQSTQWAAVVSGQLGGLPTALPAIDTTAARNGGVCAVFGGRSETPTFAVPPSTLPSFERQSVVESSTSQQGTADEVDLPPGSAALVRSADGSATTFLVGDIGKKFAAQDSDVVAAFGYDAAKAVRLPAALLSLIPSGKALVPSEARRPVTG